MQATLMQRSWGKLAGWARDLHGLFFDPTKEARLSIGVARIGLAVALLWTLWNYAKHFGVYGGIEEYAEAFASTKFHAFGILRPFGDNPPSPDFLLWTWRIAIVASVMSLIGLFSRPATIVAVVSVLIITTYKEGSYPYWSHGYLVVMVAGLAFMFGQSGASLSLDRLLSKRIATYPFRSETSLGYWWPVAAGQAAIALFYFGAGIAKVVNGGLIDWIVSDNLRNSLAVTWYGYEYYDVPWYIEQMMDTRWLWILGAAGHLFTQFYPMLAVVHKNKPWLRLSEGVVYFGGVFLLHIVMTVWNPVWLPLVVFFIDWDWVARSLGRDQYVPAIEAPSLANKHTRSANRVVKGFIAAFFSMYIVTFTFQLGHWHLLYPFSSLDFYSDVRAKKPYDQHFPYDFYRGQVAVKLERCDLQLSDWEDAESIVGDPIMTEIRERHVEALADTCRDGWYRYPHFTSTYPEFYRIEDPAQMKGGLETISTYIARSPKFNMPGIQEIAVEKAIWVYPAYPNSAKPIPVHYGARAYLELATGKFRYMNSKYYRDPETQELRLDMEILGFEDPVIDVFYRHDVRNVSAMPELKPMDGRWSSPVRFLIDEKGGTWEMPAFALYHVRERSDPDGRVWEFWGMDNLS